MDDTVESLEKEVPQRVSITIHNIDPVLITKQIQILLDLAHREREKSKRKNQPKRYESAAHLEAVLDMLKTAVVEV